MQTEVLRAYRFALDPTKAQLEALARHAGAARWAFNHALAAKMEAHNGWKEQVASLREQGSSEADARKAVRVRIPNAMDVARSWREQRNRPADLGGSPWYTEVNTYSVISGFRDADAAWKNWLDSLSGRSARHAGYPRFKKKGRCRDSFRLHHDTSRPTIRFATYRKLRLPRLGEVRLHSSAKSIAHRIDHGLAQVQSVTISRGGERWYASVLCKITTEVKKPTRRQTTRGTVGVDLGVKWLAALSQPLSENDEASRFVANPRHVKASEHKLTKAQRSLSRKQKGSGRRKEARRRVARLHHEVTQRRAGVLHQLTKRLATRFEVVAVEDLNVAGMTRSTKGTIDAPGSRVRQKAGLNRAILDAAPGELRRQLAYKTAWYGSKLAVVDRWFPSSKTCSNCGWQNPRLTLSDRTFHCTNCESTMDRDFNAARNIARHAVVADTPVACDRRETDDKNARGALVRPLAPRGERRKASKREDTAVMAVPPQRSDPLALDTSQGRQTALF